MIRTKRAAGGCKRMRDWLFHASVLVSQRIRQCFLFSGRVVWTLRSAGALGSKPGIPWEEQFEMQKFATLDFDVMRAAFEVNTIGPLLVSKAIVPLMTSPGGKILTVTSLMGSISDNTSGGAMAYRWGGRMPTAPRPTTFPRSTYSCQTLQTSSHYDE